MLINLLYGLPIMGICLLLQSLLIVTALRYYAYRQTQVSSPSFWSTLFVINGAIMIGVSTAALMLALQDAMKKTIKAQQEAIK